MASALFVDPIGNVESITNRRGQAIHYTYDAAGNVLTKTFDDGSQVVFTYDAHENLHTATDSTGTIILANDANDRLTQITYPSGRFLHYTYDTAGRRTRMVDQDGFTVNYGYDSLGRLANLTDGSNNLIDHYTYDTVGRLSREDKGNGTYTTYDYDAAGELLHLINYAPDGTVNSRFDYTYDALGRRATEATVDGSWTYTYDVIGQLTHAVFASTNVAVPSQDLAYAYDAAGNRTQTIINGVTTVYTTNNLNQYTQVGDTAYGYDLDGNMTSQADAAGATVYVFNAQNQLTGINGSSGSWTYQYDVFGNRAATTFNGLTTAYLVDPFVDSVVGQYPAIGGQTIHFSYGIGLTSQVDTGTPLFFDFDGGSNSIGLTNSSGQYVNYRSYLPFGKSLASTGAVATSFSFAGQWGVIDDGNGILDMRARKYQQTIGRFISEDPLNLGGGDYNLVRYVGNDPLIFVDPTGRMVEDEGRMQGGGGGSGNPIFKVDIDQMKDYFGKILGDILDPKLNTPPPSPIPDNGDLDVYPPDWVPYDPLENLKHKPEGPMFKAVVPPAPPTNPAGPGGSSNAVGSFDPNALYGPAGYGPAGFVSPDTPFPYRITFENDPVATAPAQRVDITDPLNANLDWSTLQFTDFGFGDHIITIPTGRNHYQTTVPMTLNDQTFEVIVQLNFDAVTGVIRASFQSIDPDTFLPPDVLTGFLPPEDGTGRGKGYISFVVQPKSNLPTGTEIRNVALVQFDLGEIIATDQVAEHDPTQGVDPNKQALNTIDAGPPTSAVLPLPSIENSETFTVSWSGADDVGGSGIVQYDVFVSDNSGPFTVWLTGTAQQSGNFTGVNGHTYGFFSIATDGVGNRQVTPLAAQATTTIDTLSITTATLPNSTIFQNYDQTVSVSGGMAPYSFTIPSGNLPIGLELNSNTGTITGMPTTPGLFNFTIVATDQIGAIASHGYAITINPVAPSVSAFTINGNDAALVGAQRSRVTNLQYTFDQAVTLDPGAFTITLHPGTTASAGLSLGIIPIVGFSGGGTSWVVTFSGPVDAGSIQDGVYDIEVNHLKVHLASSPSTTMTADYTQTFFRLFGDDNGDKIVNVTDYNSFLTTFGKSMGNPAFKAWFDFDNSGQINVTDYNAFLTRFGKGYSFS